MKEIQKQFMEKTGVSFDGIPINGVHLEYIDWLEAQIQAFRQPLVIGLVCTCTKFRETPMINGKHTCSICNKPIVQTDH